MNEPDDITLLREFAANESEVAFAALVSRHLNLVYSVALRSIGNAHAAQEISQAVFIILARKAKSLGSKTILSGWLYQTTRLTAANFLRGEIRRQNREQEAYMQSTLNDSEPEAWRQVAPLLDDAMTRLSEGDRNAIVLRFFENKNLRDVGAGLGVNEDAAKMRVTRAVEKLRKLFVKRGVVLSAVAIAGAVTANSVQAAPVELAKSVTAMAMMKGVAASDSTLTLVKGTLKIMAWTKIQSAIIVAVGILLVASGMGIYETHQYIQKRANYFPRNLWTPSGSATPEAMIKSFMWAKSIGDVNTVLAIATPQVRQEVEEKYFKNKSNQERSAILIWDAKNVTGVQIQGKTVLAADQVAYRMHFDGLPAETYSTVTMKKMDGEWRISNVEDHN